jgi:hypothetical protein
MSAVDGAVEKMVSDRLIEVAKEYLANRYAKLEISQKSFRKAHFPMEILRFP